MSEVVVQISADESRDASRLSNALDAFAKWCQDAGLTGDSAEGPDFMMLTDYSGGEMRRRVIFQDREHAARFLSFFRGEPADGPLPLPAVAAAG